jgi:WD40 repeat protein
MHRHLLWFCIATWLLAPIALHAQAKPGDIPARYRAIAGGRIRLERILGTPEVQVAWFNAKDALSTDGKRLVCVEDLSTGNAINIEARSRLLVSAPQSLSWPREINLPGKSITALALSADGNKALLAGIAQSAKDKVARSFLSLWDLNAGKEISTILISKPTDGPIFLGGIALAEDESTALMATLGFIKHWDLKTGKLLRSFENKRNYLPNVAFLPGGKEFLTTVQQGGTQRFAIGKAKPVMTYRDKGSNGFAAWSSDGKRFVSCGAAYSSVTLWDTASGKEIGTFHPEKKEQAGISSVALAPNGRTVLVAAIQPNPFSNVPDDDVPSTKLIAWDGEANKILWSHPVSYRGEAPMRIVGDKLLIGGGPNLFEVWDWKQGKKLQTWGGHKGTVNAVAALQDGNILSAGQDGALLKWRDGLLVGRTAAQQGAVVGLAVSGDRKHWLTAGTDQTVKLWRDLEAKPVQTLKGHTGSITSVAFDHTRKLAVTGSGDRTAKTWDLATGKEIASFAGHSEAVNAVAISPDDRWLATGSDDTTIRVWPIKDGKADPSREAIVLEKHTKPVTCLQFTPDGKTLLSGSQDQKLMAWDWRKGSMDFMIGGHKNWINAIALLDAKTVLTSSDDLSVCVWDLATGMEIGRVDFGAVGDCPRCLTRLGPDRFAVGTSSWMVYEFALTAPVKSKTGGGSSN